MMKQASLNKFNKGMNQDINPHDRQPDTYYSASNMRLVSQGSDTLLAVQTVKGNKILRTGEHDTDPAIKLSVNGIIVGSCYVGDNVLIFVEDYLANNIYLNLIPFNKYTGYYCQTIELFAYQPTTRVPYITAIGMYETQAIQKVYWTDGISCLKYINIAPDLNDDGTVKDGFDAADYTNAISYSTSGRIDLIQQFRGAKPTFEGYTTGFLTSGLIQYAYRMFNYSGNESSISISSDFIPLSHEVLGNTITIRGDEPGIDTGLGVKISVNLQSYDIQYDAIELIAIHYQTLNGVPSVNIVGVKEIKTGYIQTISFTDTGQYVNTMTADELRTVKGNYIFKSIEVKDNILFAGNVKDTYFNVDDYDARAFRYKAIETSTVLYYYRDSGALGHDTYTKTELDSLSKTHDAINYYNSLNGDIGATNEFKYQYNSLTLGGTGVNISYTFKLETYLVDKNAASVPVDNIIGKDDVWQLGIHRGFQRGEIYRFGIVFFDEFGRQSFVKWIGDIRMPDVTDTLVNQNSELREAVLSYTIGENIYCQSVYPVFTVSSLPSDAKTYQIVMVKRGFEDRTVLGQGLIAVLEFDAIEPHEFDSVELYEPYRYIDERNVGRYEAGVKTVVDFISPEINFNRNLKHQSGDMIYINSVYDGDTTYQQDWGGASQIAKLQDNKAYNDCEIIDLKSALIVGTGEVNSIGGLIFNNRRGLGMFDDWTGTRMVMELKNAIDTSGFDNQDYMVATYRRQVVQYGGNSYQDRLNNSYIAVSDICSTSDPVSCMKGDTYTMLYDYLNKYKYDPGTGSIVHFVIPVESSINLQFRGDDCPTKAYYKNAVLVEYLKEVDNATLYGTDINWTDMYVYNTVYSSLDENKIYYHKPLNFIPNIDNPILLRYSNTKILGEERDSFLKFNANNMRDVEGVYGAINRLVNFKNELFCFQENGFCLVPVNEQVFEQTDIGNVVAVGTGDVLGLKLNYRNGSTQVGVQGDNMVIQSNSALYWLDRNKKKIYRFTGEVNSLSDIQGLSSYLKAHVTNDTKFIGVYDNEYTEVLMTFNYSTIVYNELLGCFVGWYTINPYNYVKVPKGIFTIKEYDSTIDEYYLYQLNRGLYSVWYDEVADAIIEIINNEGGSISKQFDTLEWFSEAYVQNINVDVTFSSMSVGNSYKSYSDCGEYQVIPFTQGIHTDLYTGGLASDTLILPSNVATTRRRNRVWRLNVPRVQGRYTNEGNYRFRDAYLKIRFKLANNLSESDNIRLDLFNLVTYFVITHNE